MGIRSFTALLAASMLGMRDHELSSISPFTRYSHAPVNVQPRHPILRQSRLVGPMYSDAPPVLARGKRRTRALKLAQVVNWHDEKANLYGCHPCPKCGEVRHRAAIRRPHGTTIECAACGDKRPVRSWIS